MCGIAGVYLRGARAEPRALEPLLARLAHRGPDERGLWCEGPVGLAHTRLSIIGLDDGRQPLASADGELRLVANGEVYNYLELGAELAERGHRAGTGSDSEVILQAYRGHGEGLLERLRGMYAFALYDRGRRRLLLARDRLGIKPLFYRDAADGFHFGSELKTLLGGLERRPELDPAALVEYLQSNYASGRRTLVAGIERLLPGEAMWVGPRGIERRWRYWRLPRARPAELSEAEASERLGALLDAAVREHLRSDVPVALFLSGGVDSSLLLALAARHAGAPLRAYSVGFEEQADGGELPAAARVARHLGADHAPLVLARDALLERLALCVWSADDPIADYANLPTSVLAEHAARDYKVVLSGEGGDEVFAGYGRYRAHGPKQWLDRLRAPGTAGYRARGSLRRGWARALYRPALRAHAGAWRDRLGEHWAEMPRCWTRLQRMQAVDLATWLPDDLLVKTDRTLMAFGLEGRVPFLDHRVVEFGHALPDRLKRRGATGKLLLRRWGRELLPAGQLEGRKRGFTVPVRGWLRGPYLERLAAALAGSELFATWLEPRGLRRLVAAQQRGGRASAPLWAILQLALWQRLFVDGDGERPPARVDPLELLSDR